MVDIKELMRTYVALNDPDVRDITRKFGAVIVGLGLATVAVWGSVAFFSDDPSLNDPAATSADTGSQDGGDQLVTECVTEDEADDWRQEHQDLILANQIESVNQEGDEVCYTYRR